MKQHVQMLRGRIISAEEHLDGYDHEVAFQEKPDLRLVFHHERKISRGTAVTISQDGDIFRLSTDKGVPFSSPRGSRTYLYRKGLPLAALV